MDIQNPVCESSSVASNLSWNTFLSRTSVSSLTRAAFSDNNRDTIQSFDDVLRVLKTLDLPSFRYKEIEREEVVGEGETYLVERCVVKNNVLAIKHLKINAAPNDSILKRRLQAAVLELCVMRHPPLRKHPNIPAVFGYGWNQSGTQPLPYLLVQYSHYGTLRQYLHHVGSEILLAAKEILIGDVASGLSALHVCKIIHGDVKMDNVLVFHSWDRPAKALAKLSDFGHSIIITGAEGKQRTESARYGGTYLYAASLWPNRLEDSSNATFVLAITPPKSTTKRIAQLINLICTNAMFGHSACSPGKCFSMAKNTSLP
ncbi:kinase-like domain-containing protein [Thelonectria olida]|uniref:Kinase-like domain-containing protein n=1 Tax=Thelonectria olida TaxID=1576542 RepID=A0A9P8WHR6_9HYPO|nr:kinase-like domain-containing protein [Thelonectria olida]